MSALTDTGSMGSLNVTRGHEVEADAGVPHTGDLA